MNELKKKNSLITTLYLVLLILAPQSNADENQQVNSNIENFSYPPHSCNTKPAKPNKPGKFSAAENVEEYNNKIAKYNINVVNYNTELKTYKSCINKYIKNGNNDINTIRKQLNTALKEARQ